MTSSTNRALLLAFMVGTLCTVANWADAQIGDAKLAQGYEAGLSPKLGYETVGRLMLSVARDGGQLRVTSIDKDSPALRMKSPDNPNELASIETGDFIRAVDGQPVDSARTLQQLLGAGGIEHRLEVFDHRTQQSFEWLIEPQLVQQPQMRASLNTNRRSKLFVVIAGLTDDEEIGPGVSVSVDELTRGLKGSIAPELIEITTLTGDQCRTDAILETVLTLPTSSQDSVMVYFLGHGAFDQRFENDPARGHFFQLPGGDLLRRVMWDHIQATPARLRLLVTDTCNVQSVAKPSQKYASELKTMVREQVGPTKWEWLLLGHSGTLDVGATSRMQRAWFSSDIGGWFSKSFIQSCNASNNGQWQQVLQELPNQTQELFLTKRQEFLDNPGNTRSEVVDQLRQQNKMTPVVRSSLVRNQNPPIALDQRRSMVSEVIVRIPIND